MGAFRPGTKSIVPTSGVHVKRRLRPAQGAVLHL
jgi:hypothetical protein